MPAISVPIQLADEVGTKRYETEYLLNKPAS